VARMNSSQGAISMLPPEPDASYQSIFRKSGIRFSVRKCDNEKC
jgi:hypothetical protein